MKDTELLRPRVCIGLTLPEGIGLKDYYIYEASVLLKGHSIRKLAM